MSSSLKDIRRSSRRRNRSKKTSFKHDLYPRLVVFRSNSHIESQIIDDSRGVTIVSQSSRDKDIKSKIKKDMSKTQISTIVGEFLAKKAVKKKISQVVFDRNGYPYHGRVKALAESARENGLKI